MNLKRIYSCCLPLFFIFWMVVTMIGFSQQKTVSGNVTDENGLPLPGATVIEQGTNNGTTTDFDGAITFNLPADTGNPIPTRFTYPVNEQTLNESNYNNASSAIGGDTQTTRIFWDSE